MGAKLDELNKYLSEQRIVMVSQKVRGNPTPMGNREKDSQTTYWVCTFRYLSRDIPPFTFTLKHERSRSSYRVTPVKTALTPPTIHDALAYMRTVIVQVENKSFMEWSKALYADPYDMRSMIEHFLLVALLDGFKEFLDDRYPIIKDLIMDIFKYGY